MFSLSAAVPPESYPRSQPAISSRSVFGWFQYLTRYITRDGQGDNRILLNKGELTNTIALAVQNKMSMVDLDTIQFGAHPQLTTAPTTYPLIVCASDALKKVYVPA